MKFLFSLIVLKLLFTAHICTCQYASLSGQQVWQVEGEVASVTFDLYKNGMVDILDNLRTMKKIRVSQEHADEVRSTLLQNNLTYEVTVKDLASYMESEEMGSREKRSESQKCTSSSCPQPLTDAYMTLDQIEWYLKELKSTYPDRLSVTSIGKSIEGRDIWQVHIKPARCSLGAAVWIEGGLHAREWISPSVVLRLIPFFLQECSRINRLDVFLVPMSNPDGYLYTWTNNRLWRKNRRTGQGACDGVDLNRNWDFKFGVGASNFVCSDIYKGASPFSEPETQALRDAMIKVSDNYNLLMVMAVHSYGQALLYPWGWTTVEEAPDTEDMAGRGNLFAKAAKDPFGTEYQVLNAAKGYGTASGATDDWAKGVLKVKYSYTLELRDQGEEGFLLSPSQIDPCGKEVWAGMKLLLRAVGPSKYIIL